MTENFRNSLNQLTLVQWRLAREKNGHALRAVVVMRDIDEMRKRLPESQAEGHWSQTGSVYGLNQRPD